MKPFTSFLPSRCAAIALRWTMGLLAAMPLASLAADLLILSTPFTVPVKFEHLRHYAEESGLGFNQLTLGTADDQIAAAVAKADFVVLDAARETDLLSLRKAAGSPARWLLSQGGKTQGAGLTEEIIATLGVYYSNGGQHNGRHFMRTLAHALGQKAEPALPPQVLPPIGIYHPDLPERVVSSIAEYRQWHPLSNHAPSVAIAVLRSYLVADATAHIDVLVRELEAKGVQPVVFYSATPDVDAIKNLLMVNGQSAVGLFINTQIQYDTSRLALYQALNVPVMQAIIRWDAGGVTAWQNSKDGLSANALPFYLSIPELTGVSDPVVYASMENGVPTAIREQLDGVVNKAVRWLALTQKSASEKKIGLMFYNYPAGEKNLSAASLNVPRSLEAVIKRLREKQYTIEPADEKALIKKLQRLQAPFYHDGELSHLMRDKLAAKLPLSDYLTWFNTLPKSVQNAVNERWGAPEKSPMFSDDGQPGFVIPRLQLGQLTLTPQPPRGERIDDQEKALYHDTKSPPNHFYLASYLWLRTHAKVDALIHFGTHGTQEWMPGKERGLWVYDAPMLVLGDLPVLYPYIVDDVGEALQAKRRGRAVTISYQTPPFAPAGMHERLGKLNDLILEYQIRDDGAVRDRIKQKILAEAAKQNVLADMEWSTEHATGDFALFLDALHDHIEALVNMNQPRGLHTFGVTENDSERISTLMQMLRQPLTQALELKPEQTRALDYKKIDQHPAYQWLLIHVVKNTPLADTATAAQRDLLERAHRHYDDLNATVEIDALLAGLSGRFIQPGTGGDVIRNPDGIPTGRNLYGFDPSRIPSEAAWQTGQQALERLLVDYQKENGKAAKKLTFSLWAVETMRHGGVLEAQVLAALGVKPQWDESGRVSGVSLIPRHELNRPRVDVVLSVTGLYRDQLPGQMQLINQAVALAAAADENDNPVLQQTRALSARLQAAGLEEASAKRHALTRVFGSQSGDYGTGLNDAVAASDSWEKDDKLADLYLRRMSFAFGSDETHWNEASDKLAGAINLYAEQLKGTDIALLSRSSNLYGMLTTDDPFQYLGGLSLAIRHVTGSDPKLMISNLRDPQAVRHESASHFLAQELATRQFHPGWISALQKEGYAGTLEIVESLNNFWGWQVVAPTTTRADQWQSFHEVYVNDRYQLGVQQWFDKNNPSAQAQLIERMLEAVRKDYWKASEKTQKELLARWQDLAKQGHAQTQNKKLADFIKAKVNGFGLNNPASAPTPQPNEAATPVVTPPSPTAAEAPTVRGQKLEKIAPQTPPSWSFTPLILYAVLALFMALGVWHGRRQFHAIST